MALSSKALAVPIVSTGAVVDFPGSTAWGFFQGFGSGWMEVVSNCVRLKKIPQLLSLGSVPILRPLTNVPEIQERWFYLGGTGWRGWALPAQDEVLVHVVHVILQERVDLGWLGSCCNHLREKIIKGSACIYWLFISILWGTSSVRVGVLMWLTLLLFFFWPPSIRFGLGSPTNKRWQFYSFITEYLLPCRFPPAQGSRSWRGLSPQNAVLPSPRAWGWLCTACTHSPSRG